jgi:hypothetical protein
VEQSFRLVGLAARMRSGPHTNPARRLTQSHARVVVVTKPNGADRLVLAVLTGIDLDRKGRWHSRAAIENLSAAIRGYLAESGEAAGYVLIDRLPEWQRQRSRRSFRRERS